MLTLACALLALPAGAQSPSEVGAWSALMRWPVSATHATLQPDGKVMFFGEFGEGDDPPGLWDPVTNSVTRLTAPGYNLFCSGHSYLPDGRLLLTGGHVISHVGLPDASIYDPARRSWERLPDMWAGRWYPTNTTLADGDVMVISGEVDGAGNMNELPERWLTGSRAWRVMTGARLRLPYYPRMFLLPDGRLFAAGPWRSTYYMTTSGTGAWSPGPRGNYGTRGYGPAVFLDGKVVVFGGGDPPTATVEQIDFTEASPAWRYMRSMSERRRQHNAVLLPTGKVLVVGGSRGSGFDNRDAPVRFAEEWDPVANTWKRLASQSVYRGYHSTALLLPDGRVLSAGGRRETSAEVFSPPYLFQGARPVIGSAPEVVTPGTSFSVATPDASRVGRVTLIALGSVTHAFDQNQRLLTLPFTRTSTGLSVSAPASHALAPPGPYMLFIVNEAGVPSVARMVRVGS